MSLSMRGWQEKECSTTTQAAGLCDCPHHGPCVIPGYLLIGATAARDGGFPTYVTLNMSSRDSGQGAGREGLGVS